MRTVLSPPVAHNVRDVEKPWVGGSISDAKCLSYGGDGDLLEVDGCDRCNSRQRGVYEGDGSEGGGQAQGSKEGQRDDEGTVQGDLGQLGHLVDRECEFEEIAGNIITIFIQGSPLETGGFGPFVEPV